MPVYDYKCTCGREFSRFLRLDHYRDPQQCVCGKVAEKVLRAPAVRGDYEGYACPITGKWVEGRRAHEENLARHNCRVFEPGEREQFIKRKEREEDAFAEKVAESAAAYAEALPAAKREQLGRELETGADVTVVRQ